jgi:NH(3)-dependent NAD(+) synthetase (EC 6.3.1.5)
MLEITGLKAGETVLVSLNDWAKSCAKKIGIEAADQPVFCGNLSATQVRQTIFAGANWKNWCRRQCLTLQNEGLAQKIADCQIPPEDKIVEFVKRQMEAAGLERAALGVSGGIDSAVMAAI